VSLVRVLLASALVVVAVTGGFLAWRVWPLTDTGAGVIRGAPPPTAPGGGKPGAGPGALPAMEDGFVLHKRFPRISATAGVLVDATTGRVLWERRPHRQLPVGSLTKLMTAVVVMHSAPRLDKPFAVTPAMLGVPGYTIGLHAGQRVTVRQMLGAMLVASANDAADVLAVHRSGSQHAFVALMNTWAHRLGLHDTRYSNPSGIFDAGNHSSAWDVADLSRRFLRRHELRAIVDRKVYPAGAGSSYVSRNLLLWSYRGAIGIKTGSTTAAGDCLAAAATRHGRTLIVVFLHARGDQFRSAAKLLDFGFAHDRR
jgi:serine-type D-Ala-D-Ala carboxypeptidase (penicillin-binding protein 5/6)